MSAGGSHRKSSEKLWTCIYTQCKRNLKKLTGNLLISDWWKRLGWEAAPLPNVGYSPGTLLSHTPTNRASFQLRGCCRAPTETDDSPCGIPLIPIPIKSGFPSSFSSQRLLRTDWAPAGTQLSCLRLQDPLLTAPRRGEVWVYTLTVCCLKSWRDLLTLRERQISPSF